MLPPIAYFTYIWRFTVNRWKTKNVSIRSIYFLDRRPTIEIRSSFDKWWRIWAKLLSVARIYNGGRWSIFVRFSPYHVISLPVKCVSRLISNHVIDRPNQYICSSRESSWLSEHVLVRTYYAIERFMMWWMWRLVGTVIKWLLCVVRTVCDPSALSIHSFYEGQVPITNMRRILWEIWTGGTSLSVAKHKQKHHIKG